MILVHSSGPRGGDAQLHVASRGTVLHEALAADVHAIGAARPVPERACGDLVGSKEWHLGAGPCIAMCVLDFMGSN